jgi:cytochrome c peroxidase
MIIGCGKEEEPVVSDLDQELISLIESKSPNNKLNYFVLPESKNLNIIPQDDKNPITSAKVSLGGFLFHETALASTAVNEELKYTYSCASCHHATAGFQSGNIQGIGEGGIGFGVFGEQRHPNMSISNHDAQPIKTPTVINSAFQENLNWNGQFGSKGANLNTEALWITNTPTEVNRYNYSGVESQAIANFDIHRLEVNEDILSMGAYKKLFDAAFPQVEEENRYTNLVAGLAIAAYERTIIPYKSPWQDYLKGDKTAMNDNQKEGAKLFFGKAKCYNCHSGPALNSMDFYAIGMPDMVDASEMTLNTSVDNPENLGRASFTMLESDKYKFKVPQLYNLRDSEYFGHGASFRTIREVIEYKNNAKHTNTRVSKDQLSEEFTPLNLTNSEVLLLEEFIKYGLYDADLGRYTPDQLPSGQCFPNSDEASMLDMGCN